MKQLQDLLGHIVAQLLEENGDLDEAGIAQVIGETIPTIIPEASVVLLRELRRRAPKMLREHRALDEGFRRRNLIRWRKALDTLEMMWVIAEESGAAFNDAHRATAAATKDYQFEALTHLHARALLVAREVLCLLYGGFPDGALSRWRTLHEVTAIALFIRAHDGELSHRYLASFHFNALRAAKQLNEFATRANLKPYSTKEMAEFGRRCEALECRFGKEMRNEYGWAATVLNNPKPTFSDIEKAVKLDHWRPRYKWASQHTHGGHRPTGTLLGTTESSNPVFLVGQSNSGFTDPIHMSAISLTQLTHALLSLNPNMDQCVVMKILADLSEAIGPLALSLERRTLARARERKKKRPRKMGARSSRKRRR